LKTILTFQNITAKLKYDDTEKKIVLSNISILKNPHVSGNFKFDQLIKLDDGQLGLNLCIAMSKFELIKTLIDLARGSFSGKRNRVSIYTKRVNIDLPNLVALEMDGEVVLANNIEFSLIPLSINLLR
jgi:diacylglycerol kinase family enzyme